MKWCKVVIYVLFYVSRTKNTIFRGLNLISYSWQSRRWRPMWRPLLLTSQGSSSATTHKYTSLRKIKGFPTEGKSVSKYRNMSKNSGERFHQHSSPLYYGGGINLSARLTLNKYRLRMILGSNLSLAVNINL